MAGAESRAWWTLAKRVGERRRDRMFSETLNSTNYHLVHVSTAAALLLGAADPSRLVRSRHFALLVVFLDQLTYLPAGA